MKIARFGDTWAAAYAFGDRLMIDDWECTRLPVATQAAGAAGAFDFFGAYGSPPGPIIVNKKFTLNAATSAAIDDARDTLVDSVVSDDRSYLWLLDRDASTTYWTPAKCTRFKAGESAQEQGRWLKAIELEFFCPDGVWYGATDGSVSDVMSNLPGAIAVTNNGNYPALVNFTVAAGVDNMNCIIRGSGGGAVASYWTWDGTVGATTGLVVNARTYECTNDGADDYAHLTVGTGQVAWLWIPPGTYEIVTTDSSYIPDPAITASWHHTYLL